MTKRLNRFHGKLNDTLHRPCDWSGCEAVGQFQAPRDKEGENAPFVFCLDHVRTYNENWDYFRGMDQSSIDEAMAENYRWNRPTWPLGDAGPRLKDPFEFFPDDDWAGSTEPGPLDRPINQKDRDALKTLGLNARASAMDVKKAYKKLVKKYHPDTSKGEKDAPKLLQSVIEAYNQLSGGLKIDKGSRRQSH